MSQSGQDKARSILAHARKLPVGERTAFIASACAGDEALLHSVQDLQGSAERLHELMASPTLAHEPVDPQQSATSAVVPQTPGASAPGPQSALREGPGSLIGPYKLLQLIGEGGFGSVFMAEQERPVRRRVALKIIKLGMDTRQVVARFEQERQALAMMDHPNIARVLDAGATDTGRPYFVMELVRGEPITAYCDKNNLTVHERLAIFLQVCSAVQHAHHKGVIHRDLKPSNVLVLTHEGTALAKVIDFGIAKAADYRLTDKTVFTEFRQLIGTPQYMSPEQAEGSEDIDTRSDVYSLGVLLYELLTGSTPFDAQSLRAAAYSEIQRIIREVEPPKPSTRLSSLHEQLASVAAHRRTEPRRLGTIIRGDLDWVVMKALDKDRRRRYESPSALAHDLERYLRDEPVSAGPPTAAYKIRKFLRRHRAGTGIAAAFLLLLVTGLVVTSSLYRQADRDRRAAQAASARADEQRRQAEAATALAEQQRKAAEAQTAKVNAAYEFVSSMFSAIDPAVARGREISVREVLDKAADRAATLSAQPEVEGNVQEMIGEAYHQIAKYDVAEKHLRRAYELRRNTLGPLNAETLYSLHNLGASLLELDRIKDATDALQQAADGRAKSLGPDHSDTLASKSMLAFAIQLSGDLPAAEAAIRDVIAAQSRVLGKSARETIESRTSLSDILEKEGKIQEALDQTRSLAADAARSLGEDDTLTIETRSLLASILQAAGRDGDAETVIRQVIASRTRIFGADRPETILSEDVLGNILRSERKLEEAEKVARSVVERSRRVNGEDHSATLSYTNNLAQTLRLEGKFDEAEPLYRQVLASRRKSGGDIDRQTLISLNNLGLLMLDRKEPEQALPILQEALSGFQKAFPGHWMAGVTQVYVGEALTDLGRYDEAEPLITKGYDMIVAGLSATHPRAQAAAKSAAALYTKWGKPDQAAQWTAKAGPAPK